MRTILRIAGLGEEGVHDSEVDVVTNQISRVERTGLHAGAVLHSQIDVGRSRNAFCIDADCFVHHRDQDAVYNEARTLVDMDRSLAEGFHQLVSLAIGILRGLHAAGNLNQLHDVSRIEEMAADDLVRTIRNCVGDLSDGECRGVGADDAVLRQNGVELFEKLFLQIHSLQNNFHDKLRAGSILAVDRQGQVCQAGIHLLLRHLASLNGACEVAFDAASAAFTELLLDVNQRNSVTSLQKNFRNTGTHVACAKYSNFHLILSPIYDRHSKQWMKF